MKAETYRECKTVDLLEAIENNIDGSLYNACTLAGSISEHIHMYPVSFDRADLDLCIILGASTVKSD